MTDTFGQITVGSIVDGDVVEKIERRGKFSDDVLQITIITRSGGRRTEASDRDISDLNVTHMADPLLVDVPDADLETAATVFAWHLKQGGSTEFMLPGLHGIALEMNRRRALDCIERGCSRADDGCVCHRKDDRPAEPDVCPGHYDDDHAILHGEYFCDGTCQPA